MPFISAAFNSILILLDSYRVVHGRLCSPNRQVITAGKCFRAIVVDMHCVMANPIGRLFIPRAISPFEH